MGLRSERGPVLLSVMLSTGLVAIDATILAAAVPAVVRDLGGLSQFPWLFSIYLLAQAVSVPIYGKVADLIGRKPVMLLGVALFLAGSLLCGLAWSMGALIAFRALQGLGAGAVQPVGMTIVGDIYSVAERATVQGYIAAVWAISSRGRPHPGRPVRRLRLLALDLLRQPAAGCGRGVDALAPVRGEAAGPRPRAASTKVDVLGTVLMLVGTVLLLALLEGGVLWAWVSPVSIGCWSGRCSCSSRSCSSSGGRPSRCCRCGCSGTGWSARRWAPRSWSGCSCSG